MFNFFNKKGMNRGLQHAIDVLAKRAKNQKEEVLEWADKLISDTQARLEEAMRMLERFVEDRTSVDNSADQLKSLIQEIAKSVNPSQGSSNQSSSNQSSSNQGSSSSSAPPPPPPPPGLVPPPKDYQPARGPIMAMGDVLSGIQQGLSGLSSRGTGGSSSGSSSGSSGGSSGGTISFVEEVLNFGRRMNNPKVLKAKINRLLTEIKDLKEGDEKVKKTKMMSKNLKELTDDLTKAKAEYEKATGVKKRGMEDGITSLRCEVNAITTKITEFENQIKGAYNELKKQGENIKDMTDDLKKILEIK